MRLSIFSIGASTALLLMTASVQAQEDTHPGQVAESAVGQVGQRQTAAAIETGPMGRVNTRIQNRVQNRIRNRVDRSYDPTANTTSPFKVAAEQVTSGQPGQ